MQPNKRFSDLQRSIAGVMKIQKQVEWVYSAVGDRFVEGLVLPESIMIGPKQSKIRKEMMEEGLFAVMQLTGMLFLPKTGISASILLFDKNTYSKTKNILFVRVGKKTNDLSEFFDAIGDWKKSIDEGGEKRVSYGWQSAIVAKEKIIKNGYILSASRYCGETKWDHPEWPARPLGDVCSLQYGERLLKKDLTVGDYAVIDGRLRPQYYHGDFNRSAGTITISAKGNYAGCVNVSKKPIFVTDKCFIIEEINEDIVDKEYLYYALKNMQSRIHCLVRGIQGPQIRLSDLKNMLIPVPSKKLQSKIVKEYKSEDKCEKNL